MSAHVGDSDDLGEEEDGGESLPLGYSSNVDFLVRPALPGRKTHRGWYREVLRRRRNQERDGERAPFTGESSSSNNTTDLAEAPSGHHGNEDDRQDQFWMDLRSGMDNVAEDREEEEDDTGEGASGGVQEVQGRPVSPVLLLVGGAGGRRTSRREKNRARCLRRRQRKRERRQQQQENQKSSTAEPSSSSSSDSDSSYEDDLISDSLLCAVCLDVYFCPYMCHPCNHIFCEPCLRTLGKNCPTNTPCPLCRTIITHVFFQKELNQTARTFFPKEYLSRKQNFQKAACAKWPLPSCRKLFRMFGGFPRQWSPIARHRFSPHDRTFRVDPLELEELGERSAAGWRLDMDMVIIYIYSVNWIIGFLIFCLLCYIFFPSL